MVFQSYDHKCTATFFYESQCIEQLVFLLLVETTDVNFILYENFSDRSILDFLRMRKCSVNLVAAHEQCLLPFFSQTTIISLAKVGKTMWTQAYRKEQVHRGKRAANKGGRSV